MVITVAMCLGTHVDTQWREGTVRCCDVVLAGLGQLPDSSCKTLNVKSQTQISSLCTCCVGKGAVAESSASGLTSCQFR